MNRKLAAVAVIVGLTLIAAYALRTSNRADASAADCYAAADGPNTPTICE
jgi:hypothetical protein